LVAVVATVALSLGTLGAYSTTAGAQRVKAPLTSSENGVTATTITVTVVAAIDVPGFPGLFQGSHNGVDGWAKYINDSCNPKNTCVAGRKIVVKHVDAKLSGDAARAAFKNACQDSFALIGTGVLLLQNFDDITSCADKAGAITGMPDFGVTITEVNEQCSPSSFGINPGTLQCATKDQHPQTYIGNAGASNYYVKKFGKLKGAFLYPSDSASAKNSQVPNFTGQGKRGISMVYSHDLSALDALPAYTSVAGGIRDSGATYARSGLAFNSTVNLRTEAQTQGLTSIKVWDCSLQCYDKKLVAPENKAVVEGQYVYTPFLPFLGKTSEAKFNKTLQAFVKNTKDPDGFAVQAFAAGLFFDDAVKASTGGDPNKLTRKGLIAAAKNIHNFNAGGMIGTVDVGGKVPGTCIVLMQVKNGQFVRVFPTKKGTFDCDKKNKVTLKLDLIK